MRLLLSQLTADALDSDYQSDRIFPPEERERNCGERRTTPLLTVGGAGATYHCDLEA